MPDTVLHLADRAIGVATGLAALEPDPRAPRRRPAPGRRFADRHRPAELLAFRRDCTTVTTPAGRTAATAGLTSAAAGLGEAAEALHGLIDLAEMTGRSARTGKADLS